MGPYSSILVATTFTLIFTVAAFILTTAVIGFRFLRIHKSLLQLLNQINVCATALQMRSLPNSTMTKANETLKLPEKTDEEVEKEKSEKEKVVQESVREICKAANVDNKNYENLSFMDRMPTHLKKQVKSNANLPGGSTAPAPPIPAGSKAPNDVNYMTLAGLGDEAIFGAKQESQPAQPQGEKASNDPNYQTLAGIDDNLFGAPGGTGGAGMSAKKAPNDPNYLTLGGLENDNIFGAPQRR